MTGSQSEYRSTVEVPGDWTFALLVVVIGGRAGSPWAPQRKRFAR